jgi:crotonobetainyl-CoA:carnitine CoA-transferase CaiB-like acyl-CoA transferase
VLIAGNGDSIFRRLMQAIGRDVVPKLLGTPGRLRTPAPRLGEHNPQILGSAGWPAAQD